MLAVFRPREGHAILHAEVMIEFRRECVLNALSRHGPRRYIVANQPGRIRGGIVFGNRARKRAHLIGRDDISRKYIANKAALSVAARRRRIIDRTTTRSDGQGGFIRDVFPGNIIPTNQMSPLSRAIAKYYPAPNAPGLVRNYVSPGTMPRKRIEDAFSTKFDHNFGVKNRVAFTWTKNGEHFNDSYDS